MKLVTLTCPTNDSIAVTEEHAKRILAHPTNKIARWQVKGEKAQATDAATNDTDGNPAEAQDEQKPAKPRKSSKA